MGGKRVSQRRGEFKRSNGTDSGHQPEDVVPINNANNITSSCSKKTLWLSFFAFVLISLAFPGIYEAMWNLTQESSDAPMNHTVRSAPKKHLSTPVPTAYQTSNPNKDIPREIQEFEASTQKNFMPKKIFLEGRRIAPLELLPQKNIAKKHSVKWVWHVNQTLNRHLPTDNVRIDPQAHNHLQDHNFLIMLWQSHSITIHELHGVNTQFVFPKTTLKSHLCSL